MQQERAGTRSAAIHNRLIRCQIMLEQIGEPISRAPQMSEIYWSAFFTHMRPTPGAEKPNPRQIEAPPGTGRIRSLEELPDLLQSL